MYYKPLATLHTVAPKPIINEEFVFAGHINSEQLLAIGQTSVLFIICTFIYGLFK